jgi:hypothetical protein
MGIPEVDLGIECAARVIPPARQTRTWTLTAVFFFFFFFACRSTKLKNIEATEKAKRSLQDARSARAGQDDGDEFAANRCTAHSSVTSSPCLRC